LNRKSRDAFLFDFRRVFEYDDCVQSAQGLMIMAAKKKATAAAAKKKPAAKKAAKKK